MSSISINDVTTSYESGTATFSVTLSEASDNDITVDYYTSNKSLNFTAANIVTSANGAFSVHVADMDGDGDLDIISASAYDNAIAWYENNGAADPTWSAANISTSADGAFGVHLADIDSDGDMDIVSASYIDNAIAWYENNGAADPTWSAVDISTSADGATDVHVADIDGDGDLDIVSSSSNDDTIAWYENDENLNTRAQAGEDYIATSGTLTIAAGSTTGTITVDLINDGKKENTEIATLNLSNATKPGVMSYLSFLTKLLFCKGTHPIKIFCLRSGSMMSTYSVRSQIVMKRT